MSRNTYFLVTSILQNSNNSKQKIGQRIAYHLGLNPGPRGADDGIDGFFESEDGTKIHFQSKLRSTKLDRSDAREYFSDIGFHQADISIMLSGVGFKETFEERLFGHKSIKNVEIHLLELRDIFEKTEAYSEACQSVPELRYLEQGIKDEID
ncbi:MAG: restriction endonuclease [Gammaproteobacteria bacterium]|nr:restriction endonuclease [Gammaproteobacteria bacterium]